jgi:hypothetical protein
LRPSLVVERGAALDVYWEVYGPTLTDSLDHSIWIQREMPASGLRDLAVRWRLMTDPNVLVGVSWTEAQAGPDARAVDETGRAIARRVRIETAALPPGRYELRVGARRPSDDVAASRAVHVVVQ